MSPTGDWLYGPEINTLRDRHADYAAHMFSALSAMDRARHALDAISLELAEVERHRLGITTLGHLNVSQYGPDELRGLVRFHGEAMACARRVQEAVFAVKKPVGVARSLAATTSSGEDKAAAACDSAETYLAATRTGVQRAIELALQAEEIHAEQVVRALAAQSEERESTVVREAEVRGFFTASNAMLHGARGAFLTALERRDIARAETLHRAFVVYVQNVSSLLPPRACGVACVEELAVFRRIHGAQAAEMATLLVGVVAGGKASNAKPLRGADVKEKADDGNVDDGEAETGGRDADWELTFRAELNCAQLVRDEYRKRNDEVDVTRCDFHGFHRDAEGRGCYVDADAVKQKIVHAVLPDRLGAQTFTFVQHGVDVIPVPQIWCDIPTGLEDLRSLLGSSPSPPQSTPGAIQLQQIERLLRDGKHDDPEHVGEIDVAIDDVARFRRAQDFFANQVVERAKELATSAEKVRGTQPADIVSPKDFDVLANEQIKVRAFPVNATTTTLLDLVAGATVGEAYDLLTVLNAVTTGTNLWGEPLTPIDAWALALSILTPFVAERTMRRFLEGAKESFDFFIKTGTLPPLGFDWRSTLSELGDLARWATEVGEAAIHYLKDATTYHIRTTRPVRLYRVRSADGLRVGRFFTPNRPDFSVPSIDLVLDYSSPPRELDTFDELTVPAGADLFVGVAEVPAGMTGGLLGDGFHVFVPAATMSISVFTDSGSLR